MKDQKKEEKTAEVHIQGELPPKAEQAIATIMREAYRKMPSRQSFIHSRSLCLLNGCPDCSEKVSSR